MKGKLIAIVGADGSGKSRLSRMLCKAYGKYIPCELFAPYSSLPLFKRLTEVSKYKGAENPEDIYSRWRIDKTYQIDVLTNIRKKVLSLLGQGKMVISDRYVYCAEAYAPDLENIRHLVPKPDLIIFLDRDPEKSYKNVVKRSKRTKTKIEEYETIEGIRKVKERYERLLANINTTVVTIRIGANKSMEDIFLTAVDAINETLVKAKDIKQGVTRQEEASYSIGE